MSQSASSQQHAQAQAAQQQQQKVSSTLVLKSLSILLGLFFVFIGTMKLTPYLSKDLHKDLVSEIDWHSGRREIERKIEREWVLDATTKHSHHLLALSHSTHICWLTRICATSL